MAAILYLLSTSCTSEQIGLEEIATEIVIKEEIQPTITSKAKPTASATVLREPIQTSEATSPPSITPIEGPVETSSHQVSETLLLDLDPNKTRWIEMSPDGYRVLYVIVEEDGEYVVIDDIKEGPYDETSDWRFTVQTASTWHILPLKEKNNL